ncbi:HlyD family secretion protein [Flagellimonas meridianipacifica]|uniref:Biotin/lipoyl-binding protein n=1 Tax=Flagellimonas meridianipacifica TaxID=1080225 RepID=A0A2T0MJ07_9FLAO|nr:HlyD family efflux transporter periplasmic adaptor subunit [Allomuricauda pacifica]PRX57539.1 biotin/lipoyl-binding protein [Allomuricauda pacifica]
MVEKEIRNTKLDLPNERSDQVKEILGKTPNWMIQWGISLISGIVILLLLGTAVISYNDIIPAGIVITSKNPPVYLVGRTSGRLEQVLIAANEQVNKGQVLAEIESTARFQDIQYLKDQLNTRQAIVLELDTLKKVFPASLELGELQVAYGNYLAVYQNIILFRTLTPNIKEAEVIGRQLQEQQRFLKNQKRQLLLFEQDLALSKNNFERNKELFDKGVISKAEYEEASRSYLADQQQYEGFLTNISNTQIAIANFDNLLTKAKIQGTEFENAYIQELENAKQNLITMLEAWEQKYLIVSPIDGVVTVFDVWNQFQNVAAGEVLFTIVPKNTDGMIGRVTLPIRNSGKVKVGQRVIIKLDNYPFEEWGSLAGEVKSISEVPKRGEQALYTLYIAIDGLTTSFGKEISFRQEMQGTAEIVLEELSILERVFYEIRKLFV